MLKLAIILGALALAYAEDSKCPMTLPTGCECDDYSLGGDINRGEVDIFCSGLSQKNFENFTKQLSGKSYSGLTFINGNITELKNNVFAGISMTQFIIENNPLHTIEPLAFAKIKNLEAISITNTKLKNMPHLKHVAHQLIELSLVGNKIRKLYKNEFADLLNLQEIVLNNNDIQSIEDGVFHNMEKLHQVHIRGNNITKIGNWFDTVNSVNDLDLSDNNIETIPETLVPSLKQLMNLNLEENDIETFTKSSLSEMITRPRAHVYLQNNKIVCDARLCWLYDYVETSRNAHILGDCEEPDGLSGTPFNSVITYGPQKSVNC